MSLRRWKSYVHKIQNESQKDITNIVVGAFLLIFVITIIYLILRDPCNSRQITQIICDMYEEGAAVGSLCYTMCHHRSFSLGYCVSHPQGYVEFENNDLLYRVNGDLKSLKTFAHLSYPPEGTTIGDFSSSLVAYLESQLGDADHSQLLHDLLQFADSNRNGQLSLTESRTLWTLLQSPDFLNFFMFHGHFHFPSINGTCASLVALQNVFRKPIYTKPGRVGSFFAPLSYLWGVPVWARRVKITVGLLEALFTLYENYNVEFNLCDLGERTATYNPRNYEGAISDVSTIVSRHSLATRLANRTCYFDRDCKYSPDCTTICDARSRRCTGVPTVPTVARLCSLLVPYLVPSAPNSVSGELKMHLKRCSMLDNRAVDHELQNNVVLHRLSTFLWDIVKWDRAS